MIKLIELCDTSTHLIKRVLFMCCKINRWVFAIFFGLWGFGSLQAQEIEACSYLQNQTGGLSVCKSSGADSRVINKIDLKGSITKYILDAISSVQFQSNEAIIELDLSDNPRLTVLPAFIFDLPNLVQLDISNTGISSFDGSICQLKRLEKLIGKNNSYKNNEIPFHTFCLERLKVLDMSDSQIRYVDEYIGKLQNLTEIVLRNHELTVLPLMLYELPYLELVDLRGYFSPNSQLNFSRDCKEVSETDKGSCRESLLEDVQCEYHKEIPFERGDGSFRQIYANMAGFSLKVFEDPNHSDLVDQTHNSPENPRLFLTDQCYIMWLGGMDYEGKSSYLLEKTIRGRTVRELRYIHDVWFGGDSLGSFIRHSVSFDIFTLGFVDNACGLDFVMEDRTKLPFWSLEVFPERFLRGGVSVSIRNRLQNHFGIYEEDWWVPDHCSHIPDFEERIEKIKQAMD